MYNVTIKKYDVVAEKAPKVAPICPIFEAGNSYIDSPAYVDGYTPAEGEGEGYGKSPLASNVPGFGKIDYDVPATAGIPYPSGIGSINLDAVGTKGSDDIGTYVEFSMEVESYKDALYYANLGDELEDQGYVITVDGLTAAATVTENGTNSGDTEGDTTTEGGEEPVVE